jgi:hypothetical protein
LWKKNKEGKIWKTSVEEKQDETIWKIFMKEEIERFCGRKSRGDNLKVPQYDLECLGR